MHVHELPFEKNEINRYHLFLFIPCSKISLHILFILIQMKQLSYVTSMKQHIALVDCIRYNGNLPVSQIFLIHYTRFDILLQRLSEVTGTAFHLASHNILKVQMIPFRLVKFSEQVYHFNAAT